MIKPFIKICGVQTAVIASMAVQAGAHFIGILFVTHSKRCVPLETAALIAHAVKQSGGIAVAVFAEQNADDMQAICQYTGIHMVQLHGKCARQQHHLLPKKYRRIYVQSVTQTGDLQPDVDAGLQYLEKDRDILLFDNVNAGSGKTFNWRNFHYNGNLMWGLAGGLNSQNVRQAIYTLQPHLLDVSSGVENTLGEKDSGKIGAIIAAVGDCYE